MTISLQKHDARRGACNHQRTAAPKTEADRFPCISTESVNPGKFKFKLKLLHPTGNKSASASQRHSIPWGQRSRSSLYTNPTYLLRKPIILSPHVALAGLVRVRVRVRVLRCCCSSYCCCCFCCWKKRRELEGRASSKDGMCLRGVPHFSHTLKFRSHPKADGKVDVARRKVGKGGLRETRLKIYTIRLKAYSQSSNLFSVTSSMFLSLCFKKASLRRLFKFGSRTTMRFKVLSADWSLFCTLPMISLTYVNMPFFSNSTDLGHCWRNSPFRVLVPPAYLLISLPITMCSHSITVV